MKVQIQIPKGWRRVTQGKVKEETDLVMKWDDQKRQWIWDTARGYGGVPVWGFYGVIRRVADARRRRA